MIFKPGPLNAADCQRLNDLLRRVADLEGVRALPPLKTNRAGGGRPVVSLDPRDSLLGEVVSSAGAPPVHTVKRMTRDTANAVVEHQPYLDWTRVLNPSGTAIPAGTLVEVVPIPDWSGWWWAFPLGLTPAECVGCGWIAGLKDTAEFECLKATILDGLGECGCVDETMEFYFDSSDGTTWESSSPFEPCCDTPAAGGVLRFVRDKDGDGGGRHRLLIPSGSAVCSGTLSGDYFFAPDCCTETAIYFKGGTHHLCGDVDFPRAGHPNANTFTVKIEVTDCCPNPNFSTPDKWYCVDNVCVLLPRDPGACVTITSGPHDTEAECEAVCEGGGAPVDNDCCADVPRTLTGTWGGGCAGLPAATLLYNAGDGVWARSGGVIVCDDFGGTWDLEMYCEETTPASGVWVWKLSGPFDAPAEITATSADCDPFEVVFTIPASACCPGGGTLTVTVPP